MNRSITLLNHIITALITISYSNISGQTPLVSLNNNALKYTAYSNEGETNAINHIPDFSFAGYKGGGVALPNVPVVKTIEPIAGDCSKLIQDAIDEISAYNPDAKGFRGAILLKKGIYLISDSIVIRTNGVILRGEGNGTNGTVLIATRKMQCTPLHIMGTGIGYGEVSGSRVKITSSYVGTGSTSFSVAPDHSFGEGDKVVIQKTPNDAWIALLDMAQYGWVAKDYKITFERKVIKTEGSTIFIDIPIVDPFQQIYGGAEIFKSNITGRVTNCGIENMRIESNYTGETDEEHGWNGILLERAENCWVKNVIAKYFGYSCVNISNMSVFNTVEDCAMVDPKALTTGGRKYSFNLESNSTCNLFSRCVTWGGRHDYVTGSRVPGPNVFIDCDAENTFSDIGPHHRWATGLLFDNIRGGQIHVQNRMAMGSGHGWAGAQTIFWNCTSYKDDIKIESPPSARNFGLGCIGIRKNGTGYWESWGTNIVPRSLYMKQLEERLGNQAVFNVTTETQRNGQIWDNLKENALRIASEEKVSILTALPVNNSINKISVVYDSGLLKINMSGTLTRKVKKIGVFDSKGCVVFETGHSESNPSLQTGQLPYGIYILNLTTDNQVYKLKFLSQN